MSRPVSPLLPLQLFEFGIPEKQYTAWSRMVQNCGLHKVWLERDSPITHITFNPKNPSHILLHDIYMFCVLDKSLVSPRARSGGLGLCPGHLPCPARLSPSPLGAEGGMCGTEAVVVWAALTRAMRSPRSPCRTTVPS